jgi:succinate dehydrogenase / fumarate reductase cytochrome b subunit
VNSKKPKNLNLLTIHFPIPAIVSILHRVSGVVLFLAIPLLLWGLSLSLNSQEHFDELQRFLTLPWVRFIVWVTLSAFIYHFVAGLRHLLMDIHIGEKLKSGRIGAFLTLVVSIVLIILTGIWLW